MKLLTSPKEIDKTIATLLEKYRHFDWLSAWAGVSFPSYNIFYKLQHKCRHVIIGTHFYQTHPDFIESTIGNKSVRFVKQTDELFHPKVYLFYNSDSDWQLLIGSANFTHGAFTSNIEVMVQLNQDSTNATTILKQLESLLSKCWGKAESFTQQELERYRIAWKNATRKKESLTQNYGDKHSFINVLDTTTFTMSWRQYINRLGKSGTELNMRLALLKMAKERFTEYSQFSKIPLEERKFIAGIANHFESGISGDEPWKAFGTMSGFGIFANRIINNDKNISDALDCIPLTGQITRTDYVSFISLFCKAFPDYPNPIGTATRLLSMKRPDLFYCLTSANQQRFCKDFGVTRSHINVGTYWDMVIERIQDSDWWQNPHPKNQFEILIKNSRAAFLDSIYYQWE